MAKKKRKSRETRRQSSADLRRNGLALFNQGKYSQAIEVWERVGQQTPDMLPVSALAEAYFRRGLNYLYGGKPDPSAGLADLERAAALKPQEARYTYHLGLAAHRQGDIDRAIDAYRQVRLSRDTFAGRAAYPLALALLQKGEDPSADPVWADLSDAERTMLKQARAFRRRPYAVVPEAPALWRAMAAMDVGELEQARLALDQALEAPVNSLERGITHYYYGVLAAREEDWESARRHWSTACAYGLHMPRLNNNLAEAYHQLAEEYMTRNDMEGAIMAAREALRHKPGDKTLTALLSQACQHLAYQAASDGNWEAARRHWEEANAVDKGNFRVLYNLALVYERLGDLLKAGETWREALRHRPRKADHPDALSSEQVAQLWRRAAEAYSKAGEYDEAINVYRLAAKWDPDNVGVRLALAEALLTDGRLVSAENELSRILEQHPDNIQALLRMGEVISAQGYWWHNPTRYWQRVLELDPENGAARQLLADFYQDQAERALYWGNEARALEMYQQALNYQPNSGEILVGIGQCYLRKNQDKAREYFDRAIAQRKDDLKVYGGVIQAWFDAGKPEQAWQTLEQAEAAVSEIPHDFYLSQASYFIGDYPPEVARPWLERAIARAPQGFPILAAIGEMATVSGAPDVAREYLERAITEGQSPGQAHLLLGILDKKEGDTRSAERHWREAERIARRDKDDELLERIRMARIIFSAPPDLLSTMLGADDLFFPEDFFE